VQVAIILVITHTSGMIMGICGIAKDILVVLSSLIVFKSPVTTTQVRGSEGEIE
jgi:type IV secretory pathway VirB2 component (pilin)